MLSENYLLVYSYDFDVGEGYFDYCTVFKSKSTGSYIIVPDSIHSEFHSRNDDIKDYDLVSRGVMTPELKNKLFKGGKYDTANT